MPTSTTETDRQVPGWAKAAALLGLGVVFGGLADFALSQAGYASLGALAWAVVYTGVVVAVWAVWLRGLEFEPGG
jgi:hypothetical protein